VADNLSKTYGKFVGLSDFSLNLEGAKCVGFLGPNGAGKTTTLKIFTGLIRPTRGKAYINGVDVNKSLKKALSSCGALIETPEIYPAFTVREALMMLGQIRGMSKKELKVRIDEVVAEVKMSEWIDKRVGKFSKGMKQRTTIAASLLSDPEIVILDEPSNGLDPRGMSDVRDIVKSLKKQNKLIFMSSHLLSEVSDICDEVAMIDHGKLIKYDTIKNVTKSFTGSGEFVDVGFSNPLQNGSVIEKISKLKEIVEVEKIDDQNLRLRFKGGAKTQESLLITLASMKIGLISFKDVTSSLEGAYLNLISDSR
jgi:ABC-2 type transport system ATP-binding protein